MDLLYISQAQVVYFLSHTLFYNRLKAPHTTRISKILSALIISWSRV